MEATVQNIFCLLFSKLKV